MYISQLKLWNFRQFGETDHSIDLSKPHLDIDFLPLMNVLIGENDSGKTAIIDAIRIILHTHTNEHYWVSDSDFYLSATKFRIEIVIKGLSDIEASHFTEWLGWEKDTHTPILRLIFSAERKDGGIRVFDTTAGMDENGTSITIEARNYLKTTYLKPLRDADEEMRARKGSRISQILNSHKLFQITDEDGKHEFEEFIKEANSKIEHWFTDDKKGDDGESNKSQIKDVVDQFLKQFINDDYLSILTISDPSIRNILEKISLNIKDHINLGLGSMNRLYMAAELLHLSKPEWTGLRSCLIEELEAHLHPQAQLKVINALQQQSNVQYIISTHSPNLASRIKLDDNNTNIIMCRDRSAYSLRPGKTKLDKKGYKYLRHFLDVTKSNLFFARGIIFVEGWAEEILIPAIAQAIDKELSTKEISIINVGSTAFLHFARIFIPADDEKKMNYPVAIVTDLDVRPNENGTFDEESEARNSEMKKRFIDEDNNSHIKICIAKQWTLEWCLFNSKSFRIPFMSAVERVHNRTKEFQKNTEGQWNETEFKNKLIEMLLPNSNHKLDKVAVASELALSISTQHIIPEDDDMYIKYIIQAINHVCK